MTNLTYLDFELRIESYGSDYRTRVTRSPVDEQASSIFELPSTIFEQGKGAFSSAPTRRPPLAPPAMQVSSPKALGRLLFETVFKDDILVALRSSMAIAEAKHLGRLRIRLNLSDAPALIDLPWEYLFDTKRNHFLCLSSDTPIVRYLDVPGQIEPLAVKPPLQVLVIMASPIDLPSLDVELEWQKIQNALKDLKAHKLVIVERLPIPTLSELQDRLRQKSYHIIHFIGHSTFDDTTKEGVLIFEDEHRKGKIVTGAHLGTILPDAKTLRLVILNACSSAKTSPVDPFTGVGQLLLQQGIPAVIAMQFDITDQAAITLAHIFYKALSSNYPVDAALAEARKAIAIQNEELEWGTPVLYMRAADGQIFTIAQHRFTSRALIALLIIVVSGAMGIVALQTNYCGEQWIDFILRRQLPTAYSYVARAQHYRDEGYLICAQRDFDSGFLVAINEAERDQLYYGLATVTLADLDLTQELLEQAHALSQEGLRGEVAEPYLYLSDGLALCQLQRTDEAIKQIETFLQKQGASTEIQGIHRDLVAGVDISFECRMAALDLP